MRTSSRSGLSARRSQLCAVREPADHGSIEPGGPFRPEDFRQRRGSRAFRLLRGEFGVRCGSEVRIAPDLRRCVIATATTLDSGPRGGRQGAILHRADRTPIPARLIKPGARSSRSPRPSPRPTVRKPCVQADLAAGERTPCPEITHSAARVRSASNGAWSDRLRSRRVHRRARARGATRRRDEDREGRRPDRRPRRDGSVCCCATRGRRASPPPGSVVGGRFVRGRGRDHGRSDRGRACRRRAPARARRPRHADL